MSTGGAISSLMFFTLIVVLALAAALAILFFRKRSNRHPMEGVRERNLDEMRRGKPPERED